MAGASLLALIDDIASVLDDVALMTKVAAKKTAGVLGDDLALNAQQVAGVRAERELPVVWAVGVGSLKNKVILVPAALAISAFIPWAVTPLLMIGGLYLCFESVEKLAHRWLHGAGEGEAEHAGELAALADGAVDLVAFEADKIKGAIRTDFVLSAEIIVIALGTVADKPFALQVAVLSGIGLIMTIGVYGIVAGIVKMDDARRLPSAEARRARPRNRQGTAAGGAEADEVAGGDRHGGDVHGRRRHSDAWHSARASCHRTGRRGLRVAGGVVALALDVSFGVAGGALALLGVRTIARLRGRQGVGRLNRAG
jgi:predicted DNA repair protein MutK